MTREKQIEILMEDRATRSEAEKLLKNGTTIFEDFEENFDKYMEEWKYQTKLELQFMEIITNGLRHTNKQIKLLFCGRNEVMENEV